MATSNKVQIAVTADTAQAVSGLGAVKRELGDVGASATTLQGKAKAAGQGLNQMAQAGTSAGAGIGSVASKTDLAGAALAQIAPLMAAAFSGRELVQTIVQADSLKRGLVAVAGGTKEAEAELAFIKKTANELGLEINSTGQAYLQLTAATKGTAIEGQQTKDIFTAVSRAMSALGKSSAETENALRAVSQIASKGTVSMEELRGQLGEALPGALKAAADGMGVTTQELIKMVESGGVLAQDLLPKLAVSLDKLYAGSGSPDTLTAQFNRFKNKVTEVSTELGEAGLTKALGDLAVGGATAVGVAGNAFVGLGQTIGKVAGAVATLDFAPLAEDLSRSAIAAKVFGENVAGATAGLSAQKQAAEDLSAASSDAFRRMEIASQNAEAALSRSASNAVAQFDKLRASGDTAAEAVGKIGKDFDLANAPGIRDASAALNKLASDGKISAQELQAAWEKLLKGIDLQKFQAEAKKAFEAAGQDAKLLAQVMDATLRESIRRTGLDFDVISGGMGKAAASAVNDTEVMIAGLDRLKAQGVDTAQVLTASIGKGIATADSQKAIEAVRSQIEALRKVLGDKVADGLLDQATAKAKELSAALDAAKPGINSVAEAMKTLGITSDATLKQTAATAREAYETLRTSGTASARELQDAFAKYAETAIKANGGVASEAIKSEAAMRGLSIEGGKAGDSISRAMQGAQGSVQALGNQVQLTTEQLAAQAAALDVINSKYGQGKADRDFKNAAVGSGVGSVINTKDRGTGPVDNTGLTSLQAKRRAGTLSAQDLQTAQAVFDTAAVNKDVYDKNATAFSSEGARSILEAYNSARVLLDEVRGIGARGQAGNQGGNQGLVRTTQNNYTVKIDLGNGRANNVNVASANDAQALIRSLQDARLAA